MKSPRNNKYKLHFRFFVLILVAVLVSFWFSLPNKLFQNPTSTVAFDRDGKLLGARIADDGQWRFPEADSVPEKFNTCLLAFEDRHFYQHPGVNPFAIFRVLKQNIFESQNKLFLPAKQVCKLTPIHK